MIRFRRILLPLLLVSLWNTAPALAGDGNPSDIVSAGTLWMDEACEQVSSWVSFIVRLVASDSTDPDSTPEVFLPKPPPPGDEGV